jgi:hypothetical protein
MLGFESSFASSLSATAKLSVTNGVSKVYIFIVNCWTKKTRQILELSA